MSNYQFEIIIEDWTGVLNDRGRPWFLLFRHVRNFVFTYFLPYLHSCDLLIFIWDFVFINWQM